MEELGLLSYNLGLLLILQSSMLITNHLFLSIQERLGNLVVLDYNIQLIKKVVHDFISKNILNIIKLKISSQSCWESSNWKFYY